MPCRRTIAEMSATRCPDCRMRRSFCLCGELPHMKLETRLVVVMHYREDRTATNSARLVARALAGSEIRRRGLPVPAAAEPSFEDLRRPGAIVLFPSDKAVPLTRQFAQDLRQEAEGPLTLIVPDGNWGQARRMVRREAVLESLPHVRLVDPKPSRFVRREPTPDCVSTFEAVARALGVIESEPAQDELERFFDIMVERIEYCRGNLRKSDCRYPVPEAALQEAYEAGCRGGALSRT